MPEIRAAFTAFDTQPVALAYTIGRNTGKEARELVITSKEMVRVERAPELLE